MASLGAFLAGGLLQGAGKGLMQQDEQRQRERLAEGQYQRELRLKEIEHGYRKTEQADANKLAIERDEKAAGARSANIVLTGEMNRETAREKDERDAKDPLRQAQAEQARATAEYQRRRQDAEKLVPVQDENGDTVYIPASEASGKKVGAKPGGAGGRTSVFQQKVEAYKQAYGKDAQGNERDPAAVAQEAVDFASGKRPMDDIGLRNMASQIVARRNQGSYMDPAKKKAEEDQVFDDLKKMRPGGKAADVPKSEPKPDATPAPEAEAAPQPKPAPAAEPPVNAAGKPKAGAGTKDDPYQASTQAEIDWFRANAKAGEVLIVAGKRYTK